MSRHLVINSAPGPLPGAACRMMADVSDVIDAMSLQVRVCDPQRVFKGVAFPADLKFRSLLISGPPGSGKSTLARKLGGWSEEGYVDLARDKWWTAQTLSLRPREIHLGFPFKGLSESLSVFDEEWLLSQPKPELDLQRVCIPPVQKYFFSGDWLSRYAFEFLLPTADDLFARRLLRAQKGTHKVDKSFTFEQVREQLLVFKKAAIHLYSQGVSIHLRETIEGPPIEIVSNLELSKPPVKSSGNRLKSLIRSRFSQYVNSKRMRFSNGYYLLGEKINIDQPLCSLQLTMANGKVLQLRPEFKLTSQRCAVTTGRYCLADPEAARNPVRQYLVLESKQSITLDPADSEQRGVLHLPTQYPHKHLTITNKDQRLVIHNPSYTYPLRLLLLPTFGAKEHFLKLRENRLRRIKTIFGGPIEILSKKKAFKLIRKVNTIMDDEVYRPLNNDYNPGGIIEIPAGKPLFIIGDLHGKPDNLISALTYSSLLESLERNRAILLIIGDAAHPDGEGAMDDMDSSILMMDLIFKLKIRFPEQLFYLRGNHDSFAEEIAKRGVPQGLVWAKKLTKTRGNAYRQQMQHFYQRLPYVAVSDKAIACHAGPPLETVNYEMLVNIKEFPKLRIELMNNRVKRNNHLKGYNKSDVKRFRTCLKAGNKTPLIVGHTPLDMDKTYWSNVGNIPNHFIVYSSHENWTGTIAQIENEMHPMSYPAEPLISIINSLE